MKYIENQEEGMDFPVNKKIRYFSGSTKKAHQGFLLNALSCYYSPDTYGSNAIVRERLIAIVNLR